ncbi:MAG: ABC transporter ATP-binding protein [Candidatus Poseidoniales archaeon]|uniref:ABC-type multidrug transport protein, ATPase component n=1 Tax=uncultured Poseidoniia archaeon TaxID=1697135 RepID=A0A1B1TE34_9ARCH|nr:ABC-type multidrug transport protein, ATPase component [uncultured Candidatus Thalassoarchaea sp.]RJU82097.1 MAG: ABC transporter ATP-binding protein [Candidatus Poseidoniales archaeon]|tara:strand:+ start:681 stop:1673 length:993 start_codon:yes stop_codon:yes gene_type:complete
MMPDFDQSGLPETKEWVPEQAAPVILLENVSKTYGRIHALTGITLSLSGGVTGILGMNGAGKSTLFKILMGKIKPSSGQVRLFGTNPWKNPAPYARVGFVPEHEKMYDWMTAHDFISTFARLNGLTRDEAKIEADRVLDFVGLLDVAHKQIGRFSKGMRQRTKIAHALVNDPDLIILDEPLQGCDPLARTTIMNVIRELGRMGRTVIVSSHILHEIERITEQIVILHYGRLLALGNLHAIRERLDKIPHRIDIGTENPKELAKSIIEIDSVHGIFFPQGKNLSIQTHNLGSFHSDLPKAIVKSGQKVESIDNPDDDLESILGYLTGGGRM